MKKTINFVYLLIFAAIFSTSCSEEKVESKNMEQIYQEEGVPVKVINVDKKLFQKELKYNTVLSGIKESSASAMIGGRIEQVLVKVGDFVNKDQVIITFPLDSPSAQYYQAKVAYENAKVTFERYDELFKVGGVSAQDLDNVKTQFEASKANWETVQKMVKVLAPISGYVTKVNVRETDDVRKETVLATIADLRKLKASVQISEDEIADVKIGSKAYAEWQGNKIEGNVTQIAMAMDPMSQSFGADIVFNNNDKTVKAGVTADILIEGGSSNESITIQRKNLVKKGSGYVVFVAENGTAKERKVKVGKSSGLYIEIVEGLNENDLLVVEGQSILEDNTKVKIIK